MKDQILVTDTHINEEAGSLSRIRRGSFSIFVQRRLNIYSFLTDLFLQMRQRFLKNTQGLSDHHTERAQSHALQAGEENPLCIFHLDMLHKLKGEFFCQFGDGCLALVIQAPANTGKKTFRLLLKLFVTNTIKDTHWKCS